MPYGAAKAAAETAVRPILPAATIARTSLITGDGRSPLEALVRDIASGRNAGVLFTDDIRCPVHVADLAAALLELAALGLRGMQHVAGADAVSRHELGCLIARRDGLDPARLPTATRAGQVAGPARCPARLPRDAGTAAHPAARRARVPRGQPCRFFQCACQHGAVETCCELSVAVRRMEPRGPRAVDWWFDIAARSAVVVQGSSKRCPRVLRERIQPSVDRPGRQLGQS